MRKDFALTPAQKADARAALLLLEGLGISLEEAARRAMHGKRALKRIHFSDAVDQFVRAKLDAEKRSGTIDWYQKMFAVTLPKFGERWFDEISRTELFTWHRALALSVHTKAGISRALRALWRWGITHEPQLVAVDITLGFRTKSPRNDGDARFLTVAQVAQVLAHAGRHQNALALLFFGAVRPEEVAGTGKPRLLWKHVRVDERVIRIPAEIAKTTKPRLIEGLPDTLWHWLKPGKESEPISAAHIRQATRYATETLGFWFHDATRHTVATYLLAYTSDAGKVATWLGHEGRPALLHRDYKGLTTRAEAVDYLGLRPAA